ncbi:MAG TPA: ABC transporter substrate-binding protein [Actinophytocola sp.]|nr:ABC transporter substrate-binding protein [Actinophytocola sp.]
MGAKKITMRTTAGLAVLGLVLSGCSGGGEGEDDSGGAGDPVRGGTLKYVGADDVDHLDTASGYYTVTATLMRTFTRQLFTYPALENPTEGIMPVADLATEVPTEENGGISEDGTTYTLTLREGAQWDTEPARAVVAEDFVRGFKRLCNPVQPSGGLTYYTSTIVGMQEFCDGFAKVAPEIGPMKAYIQGNDITGISAPDERTLVFELTAPAADFLNILSMKFASAAPVEYLDYIPDGAEFRQNTISNGPYRITEYVPDKSIHLERNPAWDAESDPVREAYVDAIDVTLGQGSPDAVQQQLEVGSADLSWDQPVPVTVIPRLQQSEDENFSVYPLLDTNPYLAFNHVSPNEDGAIGKLKVRQAIIYAIDKQAIARIYGGETLNETINQVIPPDNVGHEEFDLYETENDTGDPQRCKDLLAEAGYGPNELTLKAWFRNSGRHPDVAQSYQADLERCGIQVELIPTPQADYYSAYLGQPSRAKAGEWDITAPGWIPDWYGQNGRAIVQPLFETNCTVNTVNYGCYSNPDVDRMIQEALEAQSLDEAEELWHEIDRTLMEDAAFVPFKTNKKPMYHSDRVQGAKFINTLTFFDPTNLWLAQ